MSKLLFILITGLVLQGCVQNSAGTKNKTKASASTTTSSATPTFLSDEMLYWFTTAKVTGAATVNLNTSSIIYLRGKYVHTFLAKTESGASVANYQKQYCIVGNYGNSFRQVRFRAVPMTVTASNKAIERVLRLDLPSTDENTATCGITTIDSKDPTTISPDKTVAFSINDLCFSSGCTGTVVSSTSLGLYTASNGLTQVSTSSLSLSSVSLKVDVQSNTSSNETSCTNSSCSAKGFDCCTDGQCVMDASLKTNASSNTDYAQAMSDYAANPLSFINYPQIFNVCSNIAHTPPTTGGSTTTPLTTAQERVAAYLADYKCLDEVLSLGTYTLCLPGKTSTDYSTIKKKLAIACGCPSTYTDNEILTKCPDWGVRPLYSSTVQTTANIVDFYCYTPTPETSSTITNLNVTVSNRRAPHRFYSTTGVNYDDPSTQTSSVVQEGDDFYYLDDVNKMSPVNNKYNMNSVLGRMNVAMTYAQPAKVVTVELGTTYILSATSGYFTPCSQCAKDSWFNTFSPHPATTLGSGLRWSGYTTSRDSYSLNATYGNYEDTHFGRACYIPPTMIPFSHKKDSDLQTQRLNRLKTQAAFYINGYQKDWYGFNKGALIGSFDGVSWFAIGSGRRVTATSKKLFLAINGAFLDLVSRTDTVVNIIPDSSGNVTSEVDYDPTLGFTDIRQNTAGSCQYHHQCSTDADCVTQLGWEYTCAEVGQMRSKWPVYDADAKELTNQEKSGNIFEILSNTTAMGGSSKRCVYRGAGAPCVRTYSSLDGKVNQKGLTCAPNFYCAALSSGKFNDELVRSPNDMDNILFGMDANVLGRPLKYVTASKYLDSTIIANIKNSGGSGALGLTSTEIDDMGICRPGKAFASSDVTAHSNADASKRTDYISQISGCDSTATGSSRSVSCPAFGDDLNYLAYNTAASTLANYKASQNSCGAEAKLNTGSFDSAFKSIESGALSVITQIGEKKVVADACYRRPGSVCHTDLDCAPSSMHSEIANSLPLTYFGGTEAEQSYWKESLICGQGAATPSLGTSAYSTYKLSENRCCREVGKDFTMYTSGSATLVPENMGTNVNLVTSKFTSADPKANGRYSRYAVSKTALSDSTTIPSVTANTAPAKNQWKVVNETASSTCCGGGWIRKFADGTHDWKIKGRLELETANFSCLNFRSPLPSSTYSSFSLDNVSQEAYQREYESFCKAPGQNGCYQILWKDISNEYQIFPPTSYEPSTEAGSDGTLGYPATGYTRLDTSPVSDVLDDAPYYKMNHDVPYQPFPYYFQQYPYDLVTTSDGTKSSYAFFTDKTTDYGVAMYLPAYLPKGSISTVRIKYFYDDNNDGIIDSGNKVAVTISESAGSCAGVIGWPSTGSGYPFDAIGVENWCVLNNSTTGNRPVFVARAHNSGRGNWVRAGVIIDFRPIETSAARNLTVTNPGSPAYYATKLARLELIGIPQITYEPLYCNSDQSQLVPGIFSSAITTRTTFNANSFAGYNTATAYQGDTTNTGEPTTGSIGNPNYRMTYQDKLGHGAVFSSKDFACCTPLGKETTSAAKCCSGTAATTNGKIYCKLPSGTDLSVYFNKFVSNEGVGDTQPGGGLTISGTDDEIDFNAYTGEPKIRNSTFLKLEELGKAYCQSGVVRNGGAFGLFGPEPYSGPYEITDGSGSFTYPISIVDSVLDDDGGSFGKLDFDNGFRWNHHYYCQ